MTIAQDIIQRIMPDFDAYLRAGDSLDDIDEYGFTPLIEAVITQQIHIAEQLLARKVAINKTDISGRTALHWAVHYNDVEMSRLLLKHGADANAYEPSGLSVLVYPVLRGHNALKQLLYQNVAKLDFAVDFINGKLIGHRFELQGDVDIVNAAGEYVELDYEGFMLEFTVNILRDSLRRFISSYSTRHLREHFPYLHPIMDSLRDAAQLLQLQYQPQLTQEHHLQIQKIMNSPLLILPAASRGHALGFVKWGNVWAKIDRGENSLKEGTVNIYQITQPEAFNLQFILQFLFKKQPRNFFHERINAILGLKLVTRMAISSQISGNCSWANIQAIIPVAYALQNMDKIGSFTDEPALSVYHQWVEWDKDRALDESIQRFYLADYKRKASIAAILGGILFQTCDNRNLKHLERAEKILHILTLNDYEYILHSYLEEYCVKRLTRKGNNLLKILDDCGINPGIGVNPVATD